MLLELQLGNEPRGSHHPQRVVTEDADLMAARMALCEATKHVLANGFTILGISAPEKM